METSILVQNLKCGGCAHTISTKLSGIKNVFNLQVNVDESKVSFNYLEGEDVVNVKEKLKELGYPSVDDTNSFSSKAKSFISCATGKLTQ